MGYRNPPQQSKATNKTEYLDVVAFVLVDTLDDQGRRTQKSKRVRCGYAYHAELKGKPITRLKLDAMPVGNWDGQLLVQQPLPKEEQEQ